MQGCLWQDLPVSRSCHAAHDQENLTMVGQQTGSAKKLFPYYNVLILLNSKNQTVKDQQGAKIYIYRLKSTETYITTGIS